MTTTRAALEKAREALEPFAAAADKADAKAAETERLGMGRLSDSASTGLGIRFGDLRQARAALALINAALKEDQSNG